MISDRRVRVLLAKRTERPTCQEREDLAEEAEGACGEVAREAREGGGEAEAA